jgi:hypothetical protein
MSAYNPICSEEPWQAPVSGLAQHEACVRNLLRWEFLAEHALGPAVDGVFREHTLVTCSCACLENTR